MFFNELFEKSVAVNEKNLQSAENFLKELKSLNFNVYAEKLKVPILVPIGNRVLFRGELHHTNEVTVSLGADYFVKCSIAQAEVLRQHKINDVESKVDALKKEKQFYENQITFTKQNVFAKDGHEILEEYSEEEDKVWRDKHNENIKKYKQSKVKEASEPTNAISDAELWERLEELELQEELENELLDNYNEIIDKRKENTFLKNEVNLLRNAFKEENNNQESKESIIRNEHIEITKELQSISNKEPVAEEKDVNKTSKQELLQKVLEKQTELENKLQELKLREREQSRTEQDLLERLDEMEQLDELEDDMQRLDDILETEHATENEDTDDDSTIYESNELKKGITFADDDESETTEIDFSHTDTEPNKDPYDPEKGIMKPSDVYQMYSHLFENKTTSILKKSKYETKEDKPSAQKPKNVMFEEKIETSIEKPRRVMFEENTEPEEVPVERTIVVKDVVEKVGVNQHHIEGGARPTSLFKKRRMQKK